MLNFLKLRNQMKKLFYIVTAIVILTACGGKEGNNTDENVELTSLKDKLSYVLGSINAQSIVGKNDPNVMRLDMELIVKGFEANLNENMPSDCQATLEKLYGPYFQDFDSTYAAPGAECLGRFTAYSFYREMKEVEALDKIDLKMTVTGFRHGLLKKDTILPEKEKREIFANFLKDVEKMMQKKNEAAGNTMLTNAAKIPGARVFENGIIIEDLKAGKGGSPAATDDVKIEYILMNAKGDTLQSSYEMKKITGSKDPVALSLSGVIPAWTFALPKMKKGGKYKLYVPWQQGYGEQGMYNPQTQTMDIQPYESLCFVIELIDYAKQGTFVKPEPIQAQPGMQ
jgi:FKBP-type peptidyl-prolyl cis-trans isomerase FklB